MKKAPNEDKNLKNCKFKTSSEITQFNYPVIIDESGAFAAADSHIPANGRFHTFLLDKNGKVVLVGDPVNNP